MALNALSLSPKRETCCYRHLVSEQQMVSLCLSSDFTEYIHIKKKTALPSHPGYGQGLAVEKGQEEEPGNSGKRLSIET